ncbi:hypothetical protein FZ103_00155 [Streptomonospora sp. PA3]|uniref:hypothetical protein n=1 Tax=Streptomonospora sp. PA3 TaxID=2607326 RepID=UPI0012DD4C54|nr:hypothetical protein [Streptomonospora sp. PA3]MUL39606.1 hypothetical protein [Streptomonospora sp. PA3]
MTPYEYTDADGDQLRIGGVTISIHDGGDGDLAVVLLPADADGRIAIARAILQDTGATVVPPAATGTADDMPLRERVARAIWHATTGGISWDLSDPTVMGRYADAALSAVGPVVERAESERDRLRTAWMSARRRATDWRREAEARPTSTVHECCEQAQDARAAALAERRRGAWDMREQAADRADLEGEERLAEDIRHLELPEQADNATGDAQLAGDSIGGHSVGGYGDEDAEPASTPVLAERILAELRRHDYEGNGRCICGTVIGTSDGTAWTVDQDRHLAWAVASTLTEPAATAAATPSSEAPEPARDIDDLNAAISDTMHRLARLEDRHADRAATVDQRLADQSVRLADVETAQHEQRDRHTDVEGAVASVRDELADVKRRATISVRDLVERVVELESATGLSDDEHPAAERPRWRDRHGDIWEPAPSGLLRIPDHPGAAAYPREEVEHRFGPLAPVTDDCEQATAQDDLPFKVGDRVRKIGDPRIRKVTNVVLVGPARGHIVLDGGTANGHGPVSPKYYFTADSAEAGDAR